MAMHFRPELGPPLPTSLSDIEVDLPVLAAALRNSLVELSKHGLDVPPPTAEDVANAEGLLVSYASNPEVVAKAISAKRIGMMTPAALRHVDHLLKQFGSAAVGDAVQIRAYVTNKLLEESDNPDPRIRMKALELLGKISDVGLFAERTEVTVTHQTTEDLRETLRAKLGRLVKDDAVDAEVVDSPKKIVNLSAVIDRLGD
jgi:hypothetical protein